MNTFLMIVFSLFCYLSIGWAIFKSKTENYLRQDNLLCENGHPSFIFNCLLWPLALIFDVISLICQGGLYLLLVGLEKYDNWTLRNVKPIKKDE